VSLLYITNIDSCIISAIQDIYGNIAKCEHICLPVGRRTDNNGYILQKCRQTDGM